MSSIPDMDLDLENLFQPAWAQGKAEANRYEKFTGDEGARPERRRGDRRERPRGESFGERRGPRPPRSGGKFGDRKRGFDRHDERRERERTEPPAPLPEIAVTFLPDEKGVESLARQIKMTGRAYPLFQIAQLVLQKPERYAVRLAVKKKPDGAAAPRMLSGLFVCALDDTPWLSEEEAMAHVLKNHFATFYQTERTATEPPKGTYTFVAQCGMSGVILGPPNHHDYQNRLRKLHADRFARMPFDVFKARVKIVKDEAVVKKWVEEQSFKIEYVVLNVPEPLKLPNLEEVEKHFRATHKETIIKPVESHRVAGVPSRNLRSRELQRLVRTEWEQQRHFPLQLAMELSRQFATHGLQFFKVNKTYTHVSVARPQFLDLETTPVSESIKRIIAHINAHPKCSRRQLVETLAPTPQAAVIEIKPETETPLAEGTTPKTPAAAPEPTPEQNAIIADLHWLVHQGHVIEFADGRLETAKKPAPKPPRPEKKPVEEKPVAEGEVISVTEPVSQAEVAAAPAPELQTPTEAGAPAAESLAAPEAATTPPDETTEEAVESPS
ncbi:MAG: hypothetical protein ACLPRE_01950 [Limisphaerales bacterium]